MRYSDDLGEGPGAWDPDPRLPDGSVNCTSWWQSVLAEAFARSAPTPWEPARLQQRILDLLRYHDGVPLFGNRKHFLDVALDRAPGPLKRVDLRACAGAKVREKRFRPDFTRWKSFAGYGCGLRDEELLGSSGSVAFDYIPLSAIQGCMGELDPSKRYMGFPVSSPQYDSIYGGNTGPLGQVHGYLLKLREYPRKLRETRKTMGAPLKPFYLEATHAKLASGKVDTFVLWPDSVFTLNLFSGIVLYEVDPDWDWRTELALVPEAALGESARKIAACEGALPRNGGPALFTMPEFMKRRQQAHRR